MFFISQSPVGKISRKDAKTPRNKFMVISSLRLSGFARNNYFLDNLIFLIIIQVFVQDAKGLGDVEFNRFNGQIELCCDFGVFKLLKPAQHKNLFALIRKGINSFNDLSL